MRLITVLFIALVAVSCSLGPEGEIVEKYWNQFCQYEIRIQENGTYTVSAHWECINPKTKELLHLWDSFSTHVPTIEEAHDALEGLYERSTCKRMRAQEKDQR